MESAGSGPWDGKVVDGSGRILMERAMAEGPVLASFRGTLYALVEGRSCGECCCGASMACPPLVGLPEDGFAVIACQTSSEVVLREVDEMEAEMLACGDTARYIDRDKRLVPFDSDRLVELEDERLAERMEMLNQLPVGALKGAAPGA